MCIAIQRERESQNQDQSVVFTLKKREGILDCSNFDQKSDYELEKIAKLIRKAKKVDEGTLGSVEFEF